MMLMTFDRLDKNGDGDVTRAEFITALRANPELNKIFGLSGEVTIMMISDSRNLTLTANR